MRASGRKISKTESLPAPVRGLNARDAISNMPVEFATVMTNYFPTPSSVDLRKGYEEHVVGFAEPVETLATYNNGTIKKLFAASNDSIYDVTTAGALGAASVTGLTNARFQSINIGTAGGFFLMMVNGADKLRYYTGSAWDYDGGGTYTITNVDTANCIHINNFKNRIWLIEKDSFSAWYLPVSSIAGAATELDLSGIFQHGGYLMAMANWTIDNSAGIDDYAAFITSEGEVAIYQGTDPSISTTWALKGTFRMGRPIGRRCFCKAGADVLVLTSDGAFPLSKSLLTDRTQMNQAATDNISNLINADIVSYQDNYGWQPIIHPIGNKLIINVPSVEYTESHQYVMNTTHGAWSKFTGWNAVCWATLSDDLYFGASDGVYAADVGQNDNGANIEGNCQQAFSYFSLRGQIKKFNMCRPVFLSEGDITPAIVINTDFQTGRSAFSPSFTSTSGTLWDVSDWDSPNWAGGDTLSARWQSATAVGYAAGVNITVSVKDVGIKWQSTDFAFEVGGVI